MNPRVILTTERLVLRHWRSEDREPFARMNADPIVMRFMPAVLSREESDALVDRIEEHFRQRGHGPYAVELRENGTFIGYTGLYVPTFTAPFTPCIDIAWRLDCAHWNRGFATEAARAVAEDGFSETRDRGSRLVYCAGESSVATGDGEDRYDARSRR
ncbi:GNAT family N-acetyltransferase [Candidatus Korobacter versatilis]|nr:GNAT family N-acetyltransferase [Candidatus Koribacter versatilis]